MSLDAEDYSEASLAQGRLPIPEEDALTPQQEQEIYRQREKQYDHLRSYLSLVGLWALFVKGLCDDLVSGDEDLDDVLALSAATKQKDIKSWLLQQKQKVATALRQVDGSLYHLQSEILVVGCFEPDSKLSPIEIDVSAPEGVVVRASAAFIAQLPKNAEGEDVRALVEIFAARKQALARMLVRLPIHARYLTQRAEELVGDFEQFRMRKAAYRAWRADIIDGDTGRDLQTEEESFRTALSLQIRTYRLFPADIDRILTEFKGTIRRINEYEQRVIQSARGVVASFVPSFMIVARKHGISNSDLYSEGVQSLVRAMVNFDYRRGWRFMTYAGQWVKGDLRKYIKERGSAVRIPVHHQKVLNKLEKARTALQKKHGAGTNPSWEAVAEEAGVPLRLVKKLLGATGGTVYLDAPVSGDKGEGSGATIGEMLPDHQAVQADHKAAQLDTYQILKHEWSELDPLDRDLIGWSFGAFERPPMSVTQIAKTLNKTESQVETLLREARIRFQRRLLASPFAEDEDARRRLNEVFVALRPKQKKKASAAEDDEEDEEGEE